MPKKVDILFVCKKCGNMQKKDDSQSNKNWSVYPNVPCECGGEITIKVINN